MLFRSILQDVDRLNGIEYINKRLIQNKDKSMSMDKLKIMVDEIIKNNMKPLPKMRDLELVNQIILYINEINFDRENLYLIWALPSGKIYFLLRFVTLFRYKE